MGVVLALTHPYKCALASKGFKGLSGLHLPNPYCFRELASCHGPKCGFVDSLFWSRGGV